MARNASETVRVTPENWERLNSLKRPGDTFDDVITRLVEEDQEGEGDSGNPKRAAPMTAD